MSGAYEDMTRKLGARPAAAATRRGIATPPRAAASARAAAPARAAAAPRAVSGAPSASAASAANYEQVVSRMLFANDEGRFMLAVSSAIGGEGVTTASVGVARALAQSTSKKVVLVDANLRRPALHDIFGVGREPGFSGLKLTPLPTKVPNLFVVPSGAAVENPTQLATSPAARKALQGLAEHFDYVIVDCPPLLAGVDAESICRVSSGVVLVIRAGVTPREDVTRAVERIGATPVLGVILTGSDA